MLGFTNMTADDIYITDEGMAHASQTLEFDPLTIVGDPNEQPPVEEGRRFPWWLLALAAGVGVYYITQ